MIRICALYVDILMNRVDVHNDYAGFSFMKGGKMEKRLDDVQLVEVETLKTLSDLKCRFENLKDHEDESLNMISYYDGVCAGIFMSIDAIMRKCDMRDLYRYAYELADGRDEYLKESCETVNTLIDCAYDDADESQILDCKTFFSEMFGYEYHRYTDICEGVRCAKAGE